MIKKLALFIINIGLLLFSFGLNAQMDNPVSWEFAISNEPNVMGMYEITFTATIEDKWHMYSQNLPSPDDGPLPTVFTLEKSDDYVAAGKVNEVTAPHNEFDEVFEVEVNYFDKKAEFKQLINLINKDEGAKIKGSVSYMVCNETTCLPPIDVPYSLEINPQ